MNEYAVLVALIGLMTSFVGAVFAYLGKVHASQVNDAVNKRHAKQPKLYDLVLDNAHRLNQLEKRMANCPLYVARDSEQQND